jgi:hypothetical protein
LLLDGENDSVAFTMIRWLRPLLLLCFLASTTGPASAQNMQCGNKLVSKGDPQGRVLAICGNPSNVEKSSIFRSASVWVAGETNQVGASRSAQIEVPVEVWLYNLGPDRLMQRLRFEGGIVVRIETLGFGYIEGDQ